ncbi:MAG: hypothetical protein ACI9KA_001058 [Parasphingorhabdus sp.]|jgi:hypothetical protein|uniref:hypothetical protein n=1 Tax=Parasphingorhabdus sp. TaxID=2709688 RepID=UPI0039E272F4
MKIPSIKDVEANLRNCLLLKADDLYFTLAEPEGERLRNEFLGIEVIGLADENVSEQDIAAIDLERFAIAGRIRDLHKMLEERKLSLDDLHLPDTEYGRNDCLYFLEHFLSTLPNVALGGLDLTGAAYGETRQIYALSSAWLNLIETIEEAFYGATDSPVAVNHLALLSGLDERTLRNRCGPKKIIRTTTSRVRRSLKSGSHAFVSLNSLDVMDWLKSRKDFEIASIEPAWIDQRLAHATPEQVTRGLLITSIVNLGSLSSFAPTHGFTPELARNWFDRGETLPPSIKLSLTERLGI